MSDALDRLAAHPLPFATLMGVTFTAASADEVVATLPSARTSAPQAPSSMAAR